MTSAKPLTMDELRSILIAAKVTLYIAIGILDELTPNAKVNRMKIELVATGQLIDENLKSDDELRRRGACLGTQRKIREARQLVMSRPYPSAMKEGRQGWLSGAKDMMSELERAKYQ